METRWIALLVLCAAGIASFYPLVKTLADLDPYIVAFLRNAIAALALLPLILYGTSWQRPTPREWPLIFFLGFCTAVPTIFLAAGIAQTNSVLGAILMNTQPLLIGLISPFLIGESVTARKILAIGVGMVGVILVVLNGRGLEIAFDTVYLTGVSLLMLAAGIAALNKMYAKGLVRKYDGLYTVFLTSAVGSVILLVGMPFISEPAILFTLDRHEWLAGILIGTIATALPWTIWSSSLKHLDVHIAVSFNLLIPVFAAIYAVLFLDEALTIWIILGLFLTSAGVYFVQRGEKTVAVT